MEIVYVAHSASCALLLDAGGVCRWFVMKVDDDEVRASARRCVGAQFVASLDPDDPGLLGREPRIDRSVLFASVDGGRVSLIRFGPILEFERIDDAPCSTQTEAPQAEGGPDGGAPDGNADRRREAQRHHAPTRRAAAC